MALNFSMPVVKKFFSLLCYQQENEIISEGHTIDSEDYHFAGELINKGGDRCTFDGTFSSENFIYIGTFWSDGCLYINTFSSNICRIADGNIRYKVAGSGRKSQ